MTNIEIKKAAKSLYDGGWRASDKDRMIEAKNIADGSGNTWTMQDDEDTEGIIAWLAAIEKDKREENGKSLHWWLVETQRGDEFETLLKIDPETSTEDATSFAIGEFERLDRYDQKQTKSCWLMKAPREWPEDEDWLEPWNSPDQDAATVQVDILETIKNYKD